MYEIFLVLCNEHKSVPQSNIVHALLSKIPFLVYLKKKKKNQGNGLTTFLLFNDFDY